MKKFWFLPYHRCTANRQTIYRWSLVAQKVFKCEVFIWFGEKTKKIIPRDIFFSDSIYRLSCRTCNIPYLKAIKTWLFPNFDGTLSPLHDSFPMSMKLFPHCALRNEWLFPHSSENFKVDFLEEKCINCDEKLIYHLY